MRTRTHDRQPHAGIRAVLACVLLALLVPIIVACSGVTPVGFGGAARPRLENGEAERRGPIINEAAFNNAAIQATLAPYSGFVGQVRVNYEGERSAVESDLRDLGIASSDFDPNETVLVNFTDASMSYILEQLLRGALRVDYIAPEGLPTGIDFRIETPLPKSRVIQVVRDLLARNNLVMRLINGVYQIGPAELIQSLQANSSLGRPGDDTTKIVDLGSNNAPQVVAIASQLLPQGVSVMVSSSSDKVVVRANQNDVASVEAMLRQLSQMAVGSDQVAIIPLRRSAPEAVAGQLSQFYGDLIRDGGDARVSIIPLQNQQAVLVGTSDAALMRGVQQLAQQLDRSVTDASELRVIALTHRKAAELVPQLVQLFGSTAALPVATGDTGQREPTTGVMSRLNVPGAVAQTDNADGTALSVPMPPDALAGGGGGNGPFAASATPAPQSGETRIVADERTNAVLVFSTYSVYKRVREMALTLDVAQAQVIIEATVLEVELNETIETGVQFFLQARGFSMGSGIPAGAQSPARGGMAGFSGAIGDVSVDAVVKALRQVTDLKVVSSPYLTVVDGQPARLVIGDQIPFATSEQTSSNTGGTTVTRNVEILDTGVVLEITPRIHANNAVDLTVVQSVSTPSSKDGTNLTPVVATRDISSQILAQSGRTLLLGGMIQDRQELTQEGINGLDEMPLIGGLFRQNKGMARRTELLVLITPRVVRSSSEIENITRLLQSSQLPSGPVYKD